MGHEVTISSKYQIVIPREARDRAHLVPGQKLVVQVKHGQIKLIPVRPMEELIGFVKGINIEGFREEEDRL